MEHTLCDIANTRGNRSVEVKGSRLWYRTMQCTSGSCTCKYGYAGTARNPVWNTDRTAPFKD
eukprot:5835199-Lingulodinium_polyedra.AAC.1